MLDFQILYQATKDDIRMLAYVIFLQHAKDLTFLEKMFCENLKKDGHDDQSTVYHFAVDIMQRTGYKDLEHLPHIKYLTRTGKLDNEAIATAATNAVDSIPQVKDESCYDLITLLAMILKHNFIADCYISDQINFDTVIALGGTPINHILFLQFANDVLDQAGHDRLELLDVTAATAAASASVSDEDEYEDDAEDEIDDVDDDAEDLDEDDLFEESNASDEDELVDEEDDGDDNIAIAIIGGKKADLFDEDDDDDDDEKEE